jgi:hypothetical protein
LWIFAITRYQDSRKISGYQNLHQGEPINQFVGYIYKTPEAMNDITNNQRFHEFPDYFDIIGLWSNMGLLRCNNGVEVKNVEVHLAGSAANPIVSGHPITSHSDGSCNLRCILVPMSQ